MRRTRWTGVLACFATSAVVSWVALDLVLRHRGWVPALTPGERRWPSRWLW